MRPLQEVQDIRQLRTLWNEEDFTVLYNNGNYNGWRLRRLGECEGSEEFPYWYNLGRLPYGTCQTIEAVNTRDQGVSEKDRNMER